MNIKRIILLLLIINLTYTCLATAKSPGFLLVVVNEKTQPVEGATVELLKDNKLIKLAITDAKGVAHFEEVTQPGTYTFSITYTGYQRQATGSFQFPSTVNTATVNLKPVNTTLNEVTVTAHKPFIEQKQGKVVLNVDASVTNVGTTVLEVLEKSPGVTVDRNGGIALQGKTGVLVLVDDKPTYLSGADLNNLLSSMSSAQVDQIELIANPPAKYDASGNAGIINIKTKKSKVRGFNGTFTTSFGQGVYPKNSENLVLNYRSGKVNTFFTYNVNLVKYLTNLYALRKYYDTNNLLTATLEQPSYFSGTSVNNTIKTGLDYYISPKTTVGVVFSGMSIHRQGNNKATASWLNPDGAADSAINTLNKSNNQFKNGAVNINARYVISSSQDITADADLLHYALTTSENFNNKLLTPVGYEQDSRGNIPTTINIASAKMDYTLRPGKNGTLQAGWKLSHSSTDNIASYQNFEGGQWVEDNTKNNHFIYRENICALYSDFEQKWDKLTLQGGIRYEHTGYNADQLGNAVQKDSAFSRNYGGFFPSGYLSYQADTANSFTFTAGRRIDRPVFQSLNPFYFIINKYTYETGNPYLLPQYSWNMAISHQYKNLLTTSVSYSVIKNYFSQLFLDDPATGILLYSQGNVGHNYALGVSSAISLSPASWWSFTGQAVYNHKHLVGFNGNNFTTYINQLNLSATNQFNIGKVYTAEMTGFYTTRARNDLQELLYPTGQLSLGLSRPVLKKKATLKFSFRDVLYTNAMEGLTQFPNATEYFKIKRDTRVCTLSFTYRFGKAYKVATRIDNSAADEMERVGNG